MNPTRNHNSNGDSKPTGTAPSLLARLAADGELTPEQRSAVERLMKEDSGFAHRVEFDRALRERVRAALVIDGAPGDLRARIQAAMAGESAKRRPMRIGTVAQRAIAAAIAIVAIGVALAPFSPVSPWRRVAVTSLEVGSRASLVSFIESQHDDCAKLASHFRSKMSVTKLDAVPAFVLKSTGATPARLDLSGVGYEFAGIGHCAVPGRGESVHAVYRSLSEGCDPISLFIQRDTQDLALDEGQCYRVPTRRTGDSPLYVWRRDGLIYYLIGSGASSTAQARAALGAPAAETAVF